MVNSKQKSLNRHLNTPLNRITEEKNNESERHSQVKGLFSLFAVPVAVLNLVLLVVKLKEVGHVFAVNLLALYRALVTGSETIRFDVFVQRTHVLSVEVDLTVEEKSKFPVNFTREDCHSPYS